MTITERTHRPASSPETRDDNDLVGPTSAVETGRVNPSVTTRLLARWPRQTVITADVLCIAAGLFGTYAVSGRVVHGPGPGGPYLIDRPTYLMLMAVGVVSFLIAFQSQRLYTARFITRSVDELRRLVVGCLLGAAGLFTGAFLLGREISRGWAVAVPVAVFMLVAFERSALRGWFRRAREEGRLLRPVVICGANREAVAIREMLTADVSLGYRVVGLIDVGCADELHSPSPERLEETVRIIERSGATGVILAASALDLRTSNWLVRRLTDDGLHVELSSTLRDVASKRLTVRPLGQFPVVYVEPTTRDGWRAMAKRGFDVVLSGVGLLLAFPVLVAAGIAIKLSSPGPVLFRQERVGRDGATFLVLKLRTMVTDAEARLAEIAHLNEADGPLFKVRDDPRVTRVGRFLRTTSIDELPQLINVLRGEMSLVGPRPALPREVQQWSPDVHGRLRVQPGITGMWQVSGRSDSSFDDYQRLDLYYVDNWSLSTDLSILLRTVPAVLSSRGAH
jgi:exopolysaccharide biosynthesis polyprenyl glycosylphosphotransferase